MPEIGEIRKGKEISHYNNGGRNKFIWVACPDCGKPRWVQLVNNDYRSRVCKNCKGKHTRGELNVRWKGGRRSCRGYVSIFVPLDDFFYPMVRKDTNDVYEHRLVMAKHLGRCLHSWEIVHHKNHDRSDNRIENLQLVSDDRHKQITILENQIRHLETRVTILEAENVLLRGATNDRLSEID